EIYFYVPSQNALRVRIKRIGRADMLVQPQNLNDIDVPDSLCSTLNSKNFLVRDSIIGEDGILLFITKANIQHLSRALYWIMDGTFKTIPTIFCQLYTIHAPIGIADNSRVLLLVYVLMTKKSEELYRALFQDLIEFAKESNILLRPTTILTDFELAAINASRDEFPNKKILPEKNEVVQWFEDNYVHGKVRRQMHNGTLSCALPLFLPQMWSVHDSMEIGVPRTSNIVEAWHRRWENLEQQQVEHQIEAILCGTRHLKPKNGTIEREKRLDTIINNRQNCTLIEFLPKSKSPIPAKNKHKKEKKVQITISAKNKHKKRKKVQITIPGKAQIQERRESPNYHSQQRAYKRKKFQIIKPSEEQQRKKRKSKSPFPAKNKHKKGEKIGEKVQITILSEKQTQERKESPKHLSSEEQTQERRESPNYYSRQRTYKIEKIKSKTPFPVKHKKVQITEKQTQERKETKNLQKKEILVQSIEKGKQQEKLLITTVKSKVPFLAKHKKVQITKKKQ
ncbi:8920_t:CDS:2, partial [Gigaspora rosea]